MSVTIDHSQHGRGGECGPEHECCCCSKSEEREACAKQGCGFCISSVEKGVSKDNSELLMKNKHKSVVTDAENGVEFILVKKLKVDKVDKETLIAETLALMQKTDTARKPNVDTAPKVDIPKDANQKVHTDQKVDTGYVFNWVVDYERSHHCIVDDMKLLADGGEEGEGWMWQITSLKKKGKNEIAHCEDDLWKDLPSPTNMNNTKKSVEIVALKLKNDKELRLQVENDESRYAPRSKTS